MYNQVFQILRNPISSAKIITPYLKYYPPDDPYYIRLVGSIRDDYTDADLFGLRHPSPEEIKYCSPRFDDKWTLAGKVIGGTWDQRPVKFEEASFCDGVNASFYRSLEVHFDRDIEWEETPFVRQVLDQVAAGKTVWTCATRADVKEKCGRVDQLYERIADRGYQTHKDRIRGGVDDLKNTRKTALYRWLKKHTVVGKDEVCVNIARDGTLLFFAGKHRLAIAKILGLDSIPVVVLTRHEQWQEVRDRITASKATDVPAGLRIHPDLQDIV